jgi:hypothetical protein
VLFVEPYTEADFVSRYLRHVRVGVSIRLLTGKLLSVLLPAVDLDTKQSGAGPGVTSDPSLHDRFVFNDEREGSLSGASFKDGARLSPPTLTQMTDAFPDFLRIYEARWSKAKIDNWQGHLPQ